ncbi:MAG TPA: tetratricopeptide repeat protein, partial [Candidatus Nitrosotenuis sp.]|nr:tetratricopeptide repeat protein [Candidatus Nitrosotenuis sp.]
EDKELGELLNELMLHCDNSEYNDSIIYYDGMGPALMRLCSYDQAISYFDQSLRNNPNDVRVITNKGSAIGKLGKTDEAIYYYDVALDIDPTYIPALNNKANALAEQGKIESAIEIYKSILRKDPSYIIAQDNLQKAQSNLVFQRPNTETDLVNVDYPILAEPIELANSNKSDDLVKDSPHTILEQLGGVFASFFSFLR